MRVFSTGPNALASIAGWRDERQLQSHAIPEGINTVPFDEGV